MKLLVVQSNYNVFTILSKKPCNDLQYEAVFPLARKKHVLVFQQTVMILWPQTTNLNPFLQLLCVSLSDFFKGTLYESGITHFPPQSTISDTELHVH